MFVNINPEPSSMGPTLSSLDFAAKVHNFKIQGQVLYFTLLASIFLPGELVSSYKNKSQGPK